MTRLLLIRHGDTRYVGRALAGRLPGVHLSERGRKQASALAMQLEAPVHAIYSSPLERAMETAQPIAARFGLNVEAHEAFIELDTGEWTGRTFDELEGDERWKRFNRFRSVYPIPDGESMLEVQARSVRALYSLAKRHDGQTVVVVSHADVIRAALVALLGMPLEQLIRLNADPASIWTVALGTDQVVVAGTHHIE